MQRDSLWRFKELEWTKLPSKDGSVFVQKKEKNDFIGE